LASSPSFSIQFGLGIALVGIFLLFIFLAFSDWYGHKWHLTRLSKSLFIGATLAAFIYCFSVIFLPDYFSYNGTTAIFLSLNYIFATLLVFMRADSYSSEETDNNEKFIKVKILVEAMIEEKSFEEAGDIKRMLSGV